MNELEKSARRMEALGPGDLEEAARLMERAAELRLSLDETIQQLRMISQITHPDSRQFSEIH